MGALRLMLLLVVLACIASVGVWAVHGDGDRLGSVVESAPRRAAPDKASDAIPDDVIHVAVLNGTKVKNLAGDFSLLLDRVGCVADRIDNAPHDRYARSLLINRRLDDDRAAALAARLGGPPLIREYDTDAVEDVVLVIGADHVQLREILRGP